MKKLTAEMKGVVLAIICLLLILSFGYCQDGEQQAHWIEMLGSSKQSERDGGAIKMRGTFIPSNKGNWEKQLSWVRPGMVLTDVEKKLKRMTEQQFKVTAGNCSGGSCPQSYRLDHCYVLRISYSVGSYDLRNDNKDNQVISAEVIEQMEYRWVEPPPKFTGIWITYFINGQKSREINYNDGKYNGQFISFHADGSKAVVQHYIDNIAEGEDTGYFPSGRIMYRGIYKTGVQVGVWTWYNEDGTIRSTQDHANPS